MSVLKAASLVLTAAGVIAFAPLAAAQSGSYEDRFRPQGAEARLSVTLPFGSQRSHPKHDPRVEFGVRRYQTYDRPQAAAWMLKPDYTETRLGLTLTESPNLLLNGQAYALSDDAAHASTAGKVGIGVGVVVVAVVVVGAIVLASGDCFLGEAGGDGCGT